MDFSLSLFSLCKRCFFVSIWQLIGISLLGIGTSQSLALSSSLYIYPMGIEYKRQDVVRFPFETKYIKLPATVPLEIEKESESRKADHINWKVNIHPETANTPFVRENYRRSIVDEKEGEDHIVVFNDGEFEALQARLSYLGIIEKYQKNQAGGDRVHIITMNGRRRVLTRGEITQLLGLAFLNTLEGLIPEVFGASLPAGGGEAPESWSAQHRTVPWSVLRQLASLAREYEEKELKKNRSAG